MVSIAIETTAPPYVVKLRGYAHCGITANELRDDAPNADTTARSEVSPP
jgi:hypothetical protein